MVKEVLKESRFDFRGGLNTATNPEALPNNELVVCVNSRISESFGGITKRAGSRRMHGTAFNGATASNILAIHWWDFNGGQIVCHTDDGHIFHRLDSAGEYAAFTEVTPGTLLSTSVRSTMTEMQDNSGFRLYITDGTVAYAWNGTSLGSNLVGTTTFPAMNFSEQYHNRLFGNSTASGEERRVFWSKIYDSDLFDVGGPSDGGNADISVTSSEGLTALSTVGASLLVATEDAISLYTGYSDDDIQIAQDTEGLAVDIGVVGRDALQRIEHFAAFISDVGPYLATEAGIVPIGGKIENQFDLLVRTRLDQAHVAYHKGRREIWFLVAGGATSPGARSATADTLNQTIFVYSLRLQAWQGPFFYAGFEMQCIASYEDESGDEFIIAGCTDGFVRHMDFGFQDNLDSSNANGTAYAMQVEFAPEFFETGPGMAKSLTRGFFQIDCASSTLWGVSTNDGANFTDFTVPAGTTGRIIHIRKDLSGQGGRFRWRFGDNSQTTAVTLHGFVIEAYDMERPADAE